MTTPLSFRTALTAALLVGTPLLAQGPGQGAADARADTTPPAAAPAPKKVRATASMLVMPIEVQYYKPQDQRGLNVFEAPKVAGASFTGLRLQWGAAFTQQFQALGHQNTAEPRPVAATGTVRAHNGNRLQEIGWGFNNANANLMLNAQLAPGIRVQLTSYLSSRHHNETWVKDGFFLIDESPLPIAALDRVFEIATVKVGHFEINYGDAHFRRTDNGQAMFNPFVGNLIMDAFTTQIGTELYARKSGFLAMASVTGGEIRGTVLKPRDRTPALIGKLGYDGQLTPKLRVRLTGSMFRQESAQNNTLYAGDRAGSRYYYVMDNEVSEEKAQFTSGMYNPGFRDKVTATMINPFVKVGGLEFFGVIEKARGRAPLAGTETGERDVTQYAGDLVYRHLDDRLYVGGRYNTVTGRLQGFANDVTVNRTQLGGGWFLTPTVMLKAELVNQKYLDFPTTDIRNGGRFNGFMVEGTVAF